MIDFIFNLLLNTLKMFAITTLPFLAIGFFMNFCTNFLRNKFAISMGNKLFVYFTFIGVVIHELSHALMCIIFRHQITELVLFSPKKDGTLGYVMHKYNPNSLYQRMGCFFIGIAPLFGGIISIYYLSIFLLPSDVSTKFTYEYSPFLIFDVLLSKSFYLDYKSYVWMYLMFSISLHITLSGADLKGAITGLVSLIVVLLLVNLYLIIDTNAQIAVVNYLHKVAIFFINQLLMIFTLLMIFFGINYLIRNAV